MIIKSYEKGMVKIAKARGEIIKEYLLSLDSNIDSSQIIIETKNRERIVKRNNKTYKLNSYIHFYTKKHK